MSLILYPQPTGQVAVITPADPNISAEQIAATSVPEGTPYLALHALPDGFDQSFFSAYDFDPTAGAVVNIGRAQEVQRNRWRTARAPLLSQADDAVNIAIDSGDATAEATARAHRQALRDVTLTALPSDTLENIKAVWPSILGAQG
jgi:hypothetical protein